MMHLISLDMKKFVGMETINTFYFLAYYSPLMAELFVQLDQATKMCFRRIWPDYSSTIKFLAHW